MSTEAVTRVPEQTGVLPSFAQPVQECNQAGDVHRHENRIYGIAVFVGGSNAEKLSVAASELGLDVYKHTKGGWKLTNDSVDKLLPDMRDTVLFCLDNSCFFGLSDDGSMNPISKCVEGNGYHVKGALVVAPDK